jgi:zinc protease
MMKRAIWIILGALVGFPQLIIAQEMVLLQKPVSNKIVVKFMFQNGSISDPVGKEGLTALTANLIMEGGTERHTRAQIDDMIYPMAARYGASVDKEVSVFTFEFPVQFQNEFTEIMMGLMLTPSFAREDFDRVKSNQLNYVEQVIKASSDEDFSKMVLEEMLFEGTPYRHMVAGTIEGIQSINLGDVKNHYEQYFSSQNLRIGIAGKFSDNYARHIEEQMRRLPGHNIVIPELSNPGFPNGVQVRIVQKDDALGSAIYAGFPIEITREHDDFVALMVANSWLGEHRKSYGRLFQELREIRSMNYGTYSYIEWYKDGSYNQLPPPGVPRNLNYFSLWIRPVQTAESLRQQNEELKGVKTGHAHFALRLAVMELANLIENGLTEQDFIRTRDFLKNYTKLYIQTPERELGFLMDSKFYNRTDFIKEVDQKLDKLTLDDVNAAVKKYLQAENMHVAIITHNSEAKTLAPSLRQNAASPMSYSKVVKDGLPDRVLEKDKRAAVYPLKVRKVEIKESKEMFIR